ncbi:MAG TPA: glycosyltransferase [Anaerolineales bacterium]|nr:glycosyltransferase [Anaerolineales bacterium]
MKKILIFVAHTGGGHLSLGEALYDMLSHEYAVTLLDPQPSIINWHYRTVSRHALWLWEAEFKLFDGHRRARVVHTVSSLLLAERVAKALRQTDPDLVISTYPFLTSEVTYAMRRWKLDRPLVMLFSDPNGVHRSWLTEKRAAITFAPTRETYRQALNAGFDPARTRFTGWPVRGQFYHADPKDRAEFFNKIKFDPNKFTIFMQGGGEGAARFARTINTLLTLPKVQIILATGTNESLLKHYHDRANVHPIPFTKQIAPYMMAADVVMGKAGPNMIFESVTLGKPFIATAYIPGQEEVNLEFIERYELGWVALNYKSQSKLISDLINQPEKLSAKIESVNRYRQMNTEATQQIPKLVKDLLVKV